MTEKMRQRLTDLRARQAAGEHMLCPRCGEDTMKSDVHTNALSRHADGIYVCDFCGTSEALLDYMKQKLPIPLWYAFRPIRPVSGFHSMAAVDVLASIMDDQVYQLTQLFRQCIAHPENRDEYRGEAYETCAGLTELWTEPFAARFDSKDNVVFLRFRMTEDGEVDVAVNILDK